MLEAIKSYIKKWFWGIIYYVDAVETNTKMYKGLLTEEEARQRIDRIIEKYKEKIKV